MKKILKIGLIGVLHVTVYLWVLPFVILPKFGTQGAKITVAFLILISVSVLSGLLIKRKKS